MKMGRVKYFWIKFSIVLAVLTFVYTPVYGVNVQELIDEGILTPQMIEDFLGDDPLININIAGESVQASSTIQIIFLFTLIALAPTLLVMMTTFTRIIIVMHFLRSALGTQQMPPNQILIGLALFMTFFLMGPIFMRINEEAFIPYSEGLITQAQAIETGMEPIREFMLLNVRPHDISLFADLAGETYDTVDDIPYRVLIPAFILTELTIGFMFGFFVFLPFIVIDMVVASILMAMGMMMLPPAMISLPFKILLFVMIDGWSFILDILVRTFVFQ